MKLGMQLFASFVVFVTPSHALAHDLWLIPAKKMEPRAEGFIQAHSGMKFPESDHPADPAKFKRLLLVQPDGSEGRLEAAGIQERSGVLKLEPTRPGIYIASVETEPKLITRDADEFNNYLIADGLAHIYQLRKKEGNLRKPGRERSSISPKAIMQVQTGGEGDPCGLIGLPLEIVPLRNPFSLRVGETLPVRVFFGSKPLAQAKLGWDVPDGGDVPLGTVRTDHRGEALVPIGQLGLMTLRVTHMTRPNTADYEWESFWTTLTFRIPE